MSAGANVGALEVATDPEELAERGATKLRAAIVDAVRERGRAVVALSGGETPRPAYVRLAELDVPWERVELVWVDDRFVPWSSPRSNYGVALRDWLARLPIPKGNVHPMPPEGPDHEGAARAYDAELRRVLGAPAGAPPDALALDLALLGVGDDGHTASLFPGTAALDVTDRAVVAVPGEGAREPRITLTFPVLWSARRLLVLAQGPKKKPVIAAARGDGAIPARRLQRARGELVWLVDRAAAP